MKKTAFFTLVMVLVLLMGTLPASAQLGDMDNSSFTVQNVGTETATVQVTFYDDNGTEYNPTPLDSLASPTPNPFTLAQGASYEVNLSAIPNLNNGRYSVMISSDQPVVAIANLIGQNSAGTVFYNGSYSGVPDSDGAATMYLPAIVYQYYNWNSLVSIQNVGSGPTNVTVTYNCGSSTYTHSKIGLAAGASVHFDLETNAPTGMPTKCNGSAQIVSTSEPVIVVDNQTAAGIGNTQSYNGFASGASKLYVTALYDGYYTWNSSLNIRKIGSGNTNVTVAYSDGGTANCSLTDSAPSCLLQMVLSSHHPGSAKKFGATITSTSLPVVAIANAANPSNQAQTYSGVAGGASTVGVPTVMKLYYGWNTSLTCQNVGSVATSLNISYQNYTASAYNTVTLSPSANIEINQPAESFLPIKYRGSATVTANAPGAQVACIVNLTQPANQAAGMGDWSMSYNAR
ncbi:MAG: hypothetical protein KKC18_04260 [Chloroflexi bacterium]|nr:hypothetical protein [Chloroflexota bacterium]